VREGASEEEGLAGEESRTGALNRTSKRFFCNRWMRVIYSELY
jgi:hypothetical protein